MSSMVREDKIRNELVHKKSIIEVASLVSNIRENRLKLLGCILKREETE